MFVLTAVEIGKAAAWTTLDQITNWTINPGLNLLITKAGGKIDPIFVANIQQAPTITFGTPQLKDALDKCALTPAALESVAGDSAILWFRRRAAGGEFAAGATAIKVTVNLGIAYLTGIEAALGGAAIANYQIDAAYDGTNEPLVIEKEQTYTLNGTAGDEAYWTVGTGYVNSLELDAVQRFTLTTGIEIKPVNQAGSIWPVELSLKNRGASWTWETEDLAVLDTADVADLALGIGGIALDTGAVTRAFLQKVADGRLVAPTGEGNDVHIEFEASEGMISPGDSSGNNDEDGTATVTVTPTHDGTNALIIVDTADFIGIA